MSNVRKKNPIMVKVPRAHGSTKDTKKYHKAVPTNVKYLYSIDNRYRKTYMVIIEIPRWVCGNGYNNPNNRDQYIVWNGDEFWKGEIVAKKVKALIDNDKSMSEFVYWYKYDREEWLYANNIY